MGGNTIDVTFNGADTNLHAVWDTSIPTKLGGGTTQTAARTWATKETTSIKGGTWSTTSWLTGTTISDPKSSALKWATEANAYVCSDVLKDSITTIEGEDLSGTYYTDYNHVASIQIARGESPFPFL